MSRQILGRSIHRAATEIYMVYIAVIAGAVWMLLQIIEGSQGTSLAKDNPILVFLVWAFAAVALFLRFRVQAISATSLRVRAEGIAYWPVGGQAVQYGWHEIAKIRDIPASVETPVAGIEIALRSGRVIAAPYEFLTMDLAAWLSEAARHIPAEISIEPKDAPLAQFRVAREDTNLPPRYLMLSCFDRKLGRPAWNEAMTGFVLHCAVAVACLVPSLTQLPALVREPTAPRIALVLLTLPFGCFLGWVLLRDMYTLWHGHLMATLMISPRRSAWLTAAGREIQSGPWQRFRAIPLQLRAADGAHFRLAHCGFTPSAERIEEIGALLGDNPTLRHDVERYLYLMCPSRRAKCLARVLLVAVLVSVALAGAAPSTVSAGLAGLLCAALLTVESLEAWQYWRIGRD